MSKLSDELVGDPKTLGYADKTNAEAAALLNVADRPAPVESVTGQQIFEAVVPADYNALSIEQKNLFGMIVGMGTILINGTNTKAALVGMFAGATGTLAALGALQTKQVSRATELGLSRVREGTVAQARPKEEGD